MAVDRERAEIVLFVRIILMVEIVLEHDCPKDSCYCFIAESCNPHRYDGSTVVDSQMLS
jgi:hypothetical protein